MRNTFDATVKGFVAERTGLPEGPELNCLAGAALATAFLGKVPTMDDLSNYLGASAQEINLQVKLAIEHGWKEEHGELFCYFGGYIVDNGKGPRKNEVIIALACDLISSGTFVEWDEEPAERKMAREYLNKYFKPAMIQTRAQLGGYLACLEYLWARARGNDESPAVFMKHRYGRDHLLSRQLAEFVRVLWEYDMDHSPIFASDVTPKYDSMLRKMSMLMKREDSPKQK